MQSIIPQLNSRYIPVHSNTYVISSKIHWWKKSSPFIYPNVLINLISLTKEQSEEIRKDMDGELFLLTDSGGFQAISGTCSLTWETSLLKQIELNASKIFAFDIPPVKIQNDSIAVHAKLMTENEIKKIIDINIDVAIKQSYYLKEKYPEQISKFCFVMQAPSKKFYDYNIEQLNNKIGIENYNKYFPGGIVVSCKSKDILQLTIISRLLYENFILKGIYVHFLGAGSLYKMIILIRNKITTFDSSSMLQGTRINDFINPLDLNKSIQLGTNDFLMTKQFCSCPVCQSINYNKLVKTEPSMVGRYFIAHNLWHFLKANIILDAIPLDKFTKTVNQLYKIPTNINICLEFCDYTDINGFSIAYHKYKNYLKKDVSKQTLLF